MLNGGVLNLELIAEMSSNEEHIGRPLQGSQFNIQHSSFNIQHCFCNRMSEGRKEPRPTLADRFCLLPSAAFCLPLERGYVTLAERCRQKTAIRQPQVLPAHAEHDRNRCRTPRRSARVPLRRGRGSGRGEIIDMNVLLTRPTCRGGSPAATSFAAGTRTRAMAKPIRNVLRAASQAFVESPRTIVPLPASPDRRAPRAGSCLAAERRNEHRRAHDQIRRRRPSR